jgi:hypothetical protein
MTVYSVLVEARAAGLVVDVNHWQASPEGLGGHS